jgi:phosphatidylglycerophosphate synthase
VTPAFVLLEPAVGTQTIAALTVLERLVVALSRGGCGPITVVGVPSLPQFKRIGHLGIEVRHATTMPALTEPALLATSTLVTTPDDVRRARIEHGRLVSSDGRALPLGEASTWSGSVEASLADAPSVVAGHATIAIDSPAEMPAVRRRYWASLKSATDSLMDRLVNRPAGRPLSKLLVHSPISPNQVTVFQILVGFAGAALLARGGYWYAVAGAIVFQISAILDCVDGDLAYASFKETSIGKWLDIGGDNLVHIAIFVGIATGLQRAGSPAPLGLLAASTVIGTAIAFAVVLRGMLKPEVRSNPRLAALIDKMSNRDFSYIILAMALFGRLELFMWCAAVGIHLFWMAAVAVQLSGAWSPAHAETEDVR